MEQKRLVEAFAKSLAVYYAAEKAFVADPTAETMHAYNVAADRFVTLRDMGRDLNRFSDAVVRTEENESVGR